MPFLPIRALSAVALAVVATAVVATAAGCVGRTTVRTATPVPGATVPVIAISGATTAVSYRGAVVLVPTAWPVYDLDRDQSRCARLDVHAVYLGHQGPDAVCPARLLGKTEVVQIEPLDGVTAAQALPDAAASRINGQAVALEPGSEASHSIEATFPGLALVVTASFDADPSLAQGIVGSVRAAGA